MHDDFQTKSVVSSSGMPIQNSVEQRLLREKKNLDQRLEQVNKALALLEKNPEVKEILNAVSEITHF